MIRFVVLNKEKALPSNYEFGRIIRQLADDPLGRTAQRKSPVAVATRLFLCSGEW